MSAIKAFVEDVATLVASTLGIDWCDALDLVMQHLAIEELNPYSAPIEMIDDAAAYVVARVSLTGADLVAVAA